MYRTTTSSFSVFCLFHGIRGYPTLKAIKDGQSYDYEGARDLTSLQNFVNGGYTKVAAKDLPTGSFPIQVASVIWEEIGRMVSTSLSTLPYACVTFTVCCLLSAANFW